jgi:hypothetical protein
VKYNNVISALFAAFYRQSNGQPLTVKSFYFFPHWIAGVRYNSWWVAVSNFLQSKRFFSLLRHLISTVSISVCGGVRVEGRGEYFTSYENWIFIFIFERLRFST